MGVMVEVVEVIEEWMMALPDDGFDPTSGRLSMLYVLQHAPIPDSQHAPLTPDDIAAAIAHMGLQTRVYFEEGEVSRMQEA